MGRGTVWAPSGRGTTASSDAPGVERGTRMNMADPAAVVIPPAVDLVTDKVAVTVQQRAVVPFTSWVADAVRACGATGRVLHIVTRPTTRLTVPLRSVMYSRGSCWTVPYEGGYYDGLSGAALSWDGTTFVPRLDPNGALEYAEPFLRPPALSLGPQLILTFRLRHPAAAPVGAAVELLCRELTGEPPLGWGTSEPAARPWQTDELTTYCNDRAPEPTWSLFVGGGRPAAGTTLVSAVSSGIEESVALTVGYRPDEPAPYDILANTIDHLASSHHLEQLTVQQAMGPSDLTATPHWTGQPIPIGLAIGPDSVHQAGRDRALNPPGAAARPIGDHRDPAIWYPLHDGPTEAVRQRLEDLRSHLGLR